MTRPILTALALSACSAQAVEPAVSGFETTRIESYGKDCLTSFTEDQCLEACKAAFPDNGTEGNQERWLVCSVAVTKPEGAK